MRLYLVPLLACLVGCDDSSAAFTVPILPPCPAGPPAASQLCGTWAQDSLVVGSSLIVDLRQDRDSIYGAGTYTREAGRSGQLAVSGRYTAPTLSLSLRFDHEAPASFAGTVDPALQIAGTILHHTGGQSNAIFTPR